MIDPKNQPCEARDKASVFSKTYLTENIGTSTSTFLSSTEHEQKTKMHLPRSPRNNSLLKYVIDINENLKVT